MSDTEIRQLEREVVSGKRRLAIAEEEYQEDVALRKSEEINKLRRQISEVIQSVARKKQLDMVFETAVVYVSDRVDISQDVLASLEGKSAQGGEGSDSGSGAGD
jgi:outer membrane protein